METRSRTPTGWVLGIGRATDGKEVLRQLALARTIEPTNKLDALRVLEGSGVATPSHARVRRRLRAFATTSWRG